MDSREQRGAPQVSDNLDQLLNEIGSDPRDLGNMVLSDEDYARLEVLAVEYMDARMVKPLDQEKVANAKREASRMLNNAPLKDL